jgi:hypothetical protein
MKGRGSSAVSAAALALPAELKGLAADCDAEPWRSIR